MIPFEGTFKLNLSWKPLMGIVGQDLRVMEGASIPRGITLQISDDSITPQIGPQDTRPLEGSNSYFN